jgi:hypothetical protein
MSCGKCGRISDGWSTLAWMEKIMSKTNDTSKLDRPKLENRVLTESELDAVSGGLVVIPIIPILVGLLLPAVNRE